MKLISLVGKVFGRLTVLERTPENKYVCICACGKTTTVTRGNLAQGTTKSCGCYRVEASKAREARKNHSTHGVMLSYYKKNAKDRDITWKLTAEQFTKLINGNCFYCGEPPRLRMLAKKLRRANGIDRLDSTKDYVLSNCVPCCTTCNIAKNTLSSNEFVEWAYKLVRFQEKKNGDVVPS